MMNMKKLIDETDFDNLNQLSKQWTGNDEKRTVESYTNKIKNANNKKDSHVTIKNQQLHDQKQNNSHSSNENTDEAKQSQTKVNDNKNGQTYQPQKKRNVVPQIVDEDTEHFKNKLEHLLNTFKIDAVSQFMSMKKDMLEYQKQSVKSDTHKYLTMYEQKHQQLLKTKQQLLTVSREAEKKTIQVQLLSDHIAKLNKRLKSIQTLSIPFGVLYQNKQRSKMIKFKQKQAAIFNQKRLKRKSVWGWKGSHQQIKQERTIKQNQDKVETQVNEIVGRFQKQMEMLKSRLEQATRKNQEYQNNKVMLQQNLKKAFLRGVSAMNMQAMGVLTDNAQQDEWASSKQFQQTVRSEKQKSTTTYNNMSFVDHTKNSSIGQSNIQNQSMHLPKTKQPSNSHYTNASNQMNAQIQRQSVVVVPNIKSESKNHKWKQAPIMGMQQKTQNQQPRMQIVRPTTEGKVIKVIDGKSALNNNANSKKTAVQQRSRDSILRDKKQ